MQSSRAQPRLRARYWASVDRSSGRPPSLESSVHRRHPLRVLSSAQCLRAQHHRMPQLRQEKEAAAAAPPPPP